MADQTLKRASVQIKYTAASGYRAEFSAKAGSGEVSLSTGLPVPPHQAMISGIEELARILAVAGHEAEARKAVDDAFARVAAWRAKQAQ